ncbi:DNA-deoxyinosine glycosylase [Polaromonas sp.]|uniref:DNA-deoxyinosine glycosylase n=1 Tax=Polaromonas sp. TaxID=1869339 RepID=UPI003BB6FE8E
MLTGLAPLVSSHTRLLILGSFPGVASLAAQQYYGHPQNQFWKILQAIWPSCAMPTGANSYKIRSEWLLARGLGVWDVYAACEREGSLDSRIRKPVVNDFAQLRRWCPELQAIAHNGGESFKHARHVSAALAGIECSAGPPQASSAPLGGSVLHEVNSVGVLFHRLPSTSPANASWSFERKLAVWREVFEQHGLMDHQ